MDKILWSVSPEVVRGFLTANPKLQFLIIPKPKMVIPAICVEYSLQELLEISVFFRMMRQRYLTPRVFIIEGNTPHAKVLIKFEILGVSRNELSQIEDEVFVANGDQKTPVNLLTTAAFKVERWQVERFRQYFAGVRQAYVIIAEKQKPAPSRMLDPVDVFPVRYLERNPSNLLLY